MTEERKRRAVALSIVIPTNSRYHALRVCIDHLRRQDMDDLEVIIVDSTVEKNEAMLSEVCGWRAVRLLDISQVVPDASQMLAKNIGLLAAEAPIVAFLDDDCYPRPDWARQILAVFRQTGAVAVGGRVVDRRWEDEESKLGLEGELGVIDHLGRPRSGFYSNSSGPLSVQHLPGGNSAVSREAAISCGGFDTSYAGTAHIEETDFFFRLHSMGYRLVYDSSIEVYHFAATKRGHNVTNRSGSRAVMWANLNLARFRVHAVGIHRINVLLDQIWAASQKFVGAERTVLEEYTLSLWGTLRGAMSTTHTGQDHLLTARSLLDRLEGEHRSP